jgi:hypothetical protein
VLALLVRSQEKARNQHYYCEKFNVRVTTTEVPLVQNVSSGTIVACGRPYEWRDGVAGRVVAQRLALFSITVFAAQFKVLTSQAAAHAAEPLSRSFPFPDGSGGRQTVWRTPTLLVHSVVAHWRGDEAARKAAQKRSSLAASLAAGGCGGIRSLGYAHGFSPLLVLSPAAGGGKGGADGLAAVAGGGRRATTAGLVPARTRCGSSGRRRSLTRLLADQVHHTRCTDYHTLTAAQSLEQ